MVEVGRVTRCADPLESGRWTPALRTGAAAFAAVLWTAEAWADEDPASFTQVDVHGARPSPASAPKDPTVAGSVVSRDDIAAPGLRTAEVLRSQVGVQVTETGGVGTPATASVRGATAAQLPVYLAGIALNDDVAGTADLSRIPLWLVDRIEIYRGNAPLEADRLGIGGAIFIEPRMPRATEAGAGETIGSWGQHGAWGYAALGDRDAAVLAGVSAETATNDYPYLSDHGTLLAPTGSSTQTMTNAQVATYDAWLLGRMRLGAGGSVDAFANATARDQGVPTLTLVPSREAHATFDRGLGGARTRLSLDSAGRTTLEAQSSVLFAHAAYSDPLQELGLAATSVMLDGSRADEHLAVRTEATDSLTVRGALDLSSEELDRDDDGAVALRAHRLSSRVAAAAQQWLGSSLSLQALAAAQCDGTSTTSTSTCDLFAPTGRVGAAWTRPTYSAFANLGRYVRTPTLGELYGMSVLVRGNPLLQQETGLSADVGLRFAAVQHDERAARAPWGFVGGFARWSSDLVSFVRSSQGYVEPVNVGSARVMGLEAQVGAGFLRWFAADFAATVLDPRDTTQGRLVVNDILPFQSRLVFVPRLSAETHDLALGPVGRARVEVRWVYQASRYADTAGLAVIPEQSSLDAELLAQTRDKHFTVRLRATDLLDTARFDIVGFPLPGRSAFASLEESW
jgi:iron complex outermembrane receptor protein